MLIKSNDKLSKIGLTGQDYFYHQQVYEACQKHQINVFQVVDEIIAQRPKHTQKSPQLLKLLEQAQVVVDQREYQRMTRQTPTSLEWKHNNKLVISMFNVLFTALSVAVAIVYITQQESVGWKALMAFGGSMTLVVAEGYFVVKMM